MPRNEQVIVVLVASPSDLEPERNQLEDVVRELNLVWSRSFSLRLELVRWETHGYPGMGLDPQDVLNRELPDEPDIFIGLMWSRYGTETGRAGSGTEEEFRWALERYKQDPKSVRIMFYFKDAPLVPSAIDPDQLSRVQEFRASLGSEGSLYFQFGTPEEFERLLRIHLSRQIQEFAATNSSEQKAVSPIPALANSLGPETESEEEAESAELGLIDFLDSVDEHFHALNEIAGRIAKEITLLGENMRGRTQEVNAATADAPQGQLGRREARGLIEKAAGDMTQFVAKMKTEIPPVQGESAKRCHSGCTRSVDQRESEFEQQNSCGHRPQWACEVPKRTRQRLRSYKVIQGGRSRIATDDCRPQQGKEGYRDGASRPTGQHG